MNMSEKTREFLKKNIPGALSCDTSLDACDVTSDYLDIYGFGPDDEITMFGREIEAAYDDVFYSNNTIRSAP